MSTHLVQFRRFYLNGLTQSGIALAPTAIIGSLGFAGNIRRSHLQLWRSAPPTTVRTVSPLYSDDHESCHRRDLPACLVPSLGHGLDRRLREGWTVRPLRSGGHPV